MEYWTVSFLGSTPQIAGIAWLCHPCQNLQPQKLSWVGFSLHTDPSHSSVDLQSGRRCGDISTDGNFPFKLVWVPLRKKALWAQCYPRGFHRQAERLGRINQSWSNT